jgi:tripartite-type tricarboxylate transporter receptor subunit TctC
MGDHIPGRPTVVPMQMEGAGSLKLANWLYNVAPKDGLVFGTISRGIPFEPLIGNRETARFDAKAFNWIGSANNEVSTCVAWQRTGITKFEELYSKPLIVGGTGGSADSDQFPKIINGVLGTKFKLVSGYPGGNDIEFAMERGEVDGRCGYSWTTLISTRKAWYESGTVKVLVQLALAKHKDLPDVPLIMDLAKTQDQRDVLRLIFVRAALGRPFLAPPDLPADRLDALRQAFDATMKDPAFLAEAKKARLEINPVKGEDVKRLVADVYASPQRTLQRTRAILGFK